VLDVDAGARILDQGLDALEVVGLGPGELGLAVREGDLGAALAQGDRGL
jgi:hypothetical protein